MALSSNAQRVLLRATKLIGNKDCWIKGDSFRAKDGNMMGSYCAMGALYRASIEAPIEEGFTKSYYEAAAAVMRTLNNRKPCFTIPGFNDAEDTTHDDIKDLFCETVKRECCDDHNSQA